MTSRRLPPLIALRAFEAFARTGRVRSAADELCISHTVVSRHIKNLEEALGVILVERNGRSLQLTDSGLTLSKYLERSFNLIVEGAREVQRGQRQSIHICCAASVASRILVKHLPRLTADMEGSEVILHPTSERPDLRASEADAEIVFLEAPDPAGWAQSELLTQPRVIAVSSPLFKARHSEVNVPSDLAHLPLIHEQDSKLWETWLHKTGVSYVPPLHGTALWHGHLTIEAAKLGQGVALVSELIAAEYIDNDEIVEIVPSTVYVGGYYFVALGSNWEDTKLTKIREWAKAILNEHMSYWGQSEGT